jgi:hypothetical protein
MDKENQARNFDDYGIEPKRFDFSCVGFDSSNPHF